MSKSKMIKNWCICDMAIWLPLNIQYSSHLVIFSSHLVIFAPVLVNMVLKLPVNETFKESIPNCRTYSMLCVLFLFMYKSL